MTERCRKLNRPLCPYSACPDPAFHTQPTEEMLQLLTLLGLPQLQRWMLPMLQPPCLRDSTSQARRSTAAGLLSHLPPFPLDGCRLLLCE